MGLLCAVILLCCIVHNAVSMSGAVRYEPTWDSLDSRPLPQWYDDAKIGIFLHWGVYSVPSFGSEWFWNSWHNLSPTYVKFMKDNYPRGFTYQEFAKDFRAEFYDPEEWAELFKKSGAKYVVLTSKHHEGYTLWPSTYSFSWNAKDVGPHRDLLGDLANAIRQKTDLTFGLYHSLYEWYNPMFLADKENDLKTNNFSVNKVNPELRELILKYKPEIVWSDGEWEAPDTYWKSKEFLAWLYNDSPVKETVVVNDRWGSGDVICHHGDFYTCADRFNPGVLQPHKWENAMTIDKHSWGYRRTSNIEDYLTTHELLVTLAQTISCGGNLLMNVGPTSDGRIAPIFQERLLDVGQWLSVNGEAVYSSRPWTYQNDTIGNTWYTAKGTTVYAITLEWPANNTLELGRVSSLFESEDTVVDLLGNSGKLKWRQSGDIVQVIFPDKASVKSQWAWVIMIEAGSSETNRFMIPKDV